jgi:hypothetical protein
MVLIPLRFNRSWFTRNAVEAADLQEIAEKTVQDSTRQNNNLKQLGLDIGDNDYQFRNTGERTQSVSILSRIASIEATTFIGAKNISIGTGTGTLTIKAGDGTDLSNTNIAYYSLNSTSSIGRIVSLPVNSSITFTLTGAHWGLDGLGDVTDEVLHLYAIDDAGTARTGISRQGGLTKISASDTTTSAGACTTIAKILVDATVVTATCSCTEMAWVFADFDDTGNIGGENFWTIQSAVNDRHLAERGDLFVPTRGRVYFSTDNTTYLTQTGSTLDVVVSGTSVNSFGSTTIITGSTTPALNIRETGTSGSSRVNFGDSGSATSGAIVYDHSSDIMTFRIAGGGDGYKMTGAATAPAFTVRESGTSGTSRYQFGDSASDSAGAIVYDHSSDAMSFRIAGGGDGYKMTGTATDPAFTIKSTGVTGTTTLNFGNGSTDTDGRITYFHSDESIRFKVNDNINSVLQAYNSGIKVQSNTSSNTIVQMQSPTGVAGDDFQFEIGNDTLEFNANGGTTGFFEAETSGQHTFTINNRGADIDTVIKTDLSGNAFFMDAGNDRASFDVPLALKPVPGTPVANHAYSESIPKGWANFVVTSASTGNLHSSYNVSSLSVSSSVATINWDRDFSSANYVVSGNASSGSSDKVFLTFGLSTTDVACRAYDAAGSLATTFYGTLMAIGAQ